MRIKKDLSRGMMKIVNFIAVRAVALTTNSACIWLMHQPEFPGEAKRFKKRK